MNALLFRRSVEWMLRLALVSAFLSAVADRFGLWGPAGERNVAWGDWQHFVAYSARLNVIFPATVRTSLAVLATAAELGLGIGLLIPMVTKWTALGSAMLLLAFGGAMTLALGIKAPLNYSVFTAAAAAFALSNLCAAQTKSQMAGGGTPS